MFTNESGTLISHPLLRQIEQNINKTKDEWETQEARFFLQSIFYRHNPEDFEHLVFDKTIQQPTEYAIEQMLQCYDLPHNYGNKTQFYMKWLVRKITMPDNVSSFNHMSFTELINLQTMYHLGVPYKMQRFNRPYGEASIQSVGCWMAHGGFLVNPEDEDYSKNQDILTYEPYSYVAIVHDAWRDKDIDMFRVQLPDMKNNQFHRQHFFVAALHTNAKVCAHGLSENLAKQALMKNMKNKPSR